MPNWLGPRSIVGDIVWARPLRYSKIEVEVAEVSKSGRRIPNGRRSAETPYTCPARGGGRGLSRDVSTEQLYN
jgi:hypothetical protein